MLHYTWMGPASDRGANCQKKIALIASTLSFQLLQALPPISDPQWTNQLQKLPEVTI